MTTRLTLHEELLLIALDDEKGTTSLDDMSSTAMGGAILAELILAGALTVSSDKKKQIRAVPTARVDDPFAAEALAMVRAEKKPKRATHWVQKFGGMKDLKHRVAHRLAERGILAEETDKVLGIFKRRIYPEQDGGPERELVARLEEAVFTARPDLDERTVIVVALAHATGLLPRVLDKKRLKGRKERLKRISEGEVAARATKEAVEAIQAAVMIAAIMPAITAATITTTT